MEEIVNKVAQSSLVTIDLDDYLSGVEVVFFDLKPFLFQEMILKEKDFRMAIRELDWSVYNGKNVLVGCSCDAIIPTWAYMLVGSKLSGVAVDYRVGAEQEIERMKIDNAIQRLALENHQDGKVVIKGCGNLKFRDYAYAEVTKVLVGKVSSLMYGEPCSTVPVYKKPRVKGG